MGNEPWADWWPMAVPDEEPELEQALGQFILSWGVLERELDHSFAIVFRVNATLAACIYANLGTKAKVDMLTSAISMLAPLLGERLTTRSHNLLGTVSDWSNVRNTLAHGQPIQFPTDVPVRDKSAGWVLTRQSARLRYDVVWHIVNPRRWRLRSEAVQRLAVDWRAATLKLYQRLYEVSDDELDAVCGFDIRVDLRDPRRRRTRRTQSKGSSPVRSAKRGKPPPPPKTSPA